MTKSSVCAWVFVLLASFAARVDVEWIRVAAADSRPEVRQAADFVCAGTTDGGGRHA